MIEGLQNKNDDEKDKRIQELLQENKSLKVMASKTEEIATKAASSAATVVKLRAKLAEVVQAYAISQQRTAAGADDKNIIAELKEKVKKQDQVIRELRAA